MSDAVESDAGSDADAAEGLIELARLTINQGQDGLHESLVQVATLAEHAIPGADGVGVTLLERGRPDLIVASTDFVREVDAIQYGIGEGPCITAAAERRTVHSGELGDDRQWLRFGPKIRHLGVHSVLSLPLLHGEHTLGAMNVYAHDKFAFDKHAIEVGEQFAIPAAISVENAQTLAKVRRLLTPLQAALAQQAVIDRATGVIMSRRACPTDVALEELWAISRAENLSLFQAAKQLMDAAVNGAPDEGAK